MVEAIYYYPTVIIGLSLPTISEAGPGGMRFVTYLSLIHLTTSWQCMVVCQIEK